MRAGVPGFLYSGSSGICRRPGVAVGKVPPLASAAEAVLGLLILCRL
jgi:hypothetical protein